MTKENCWKCKKLKSGVKLRACEDRLCEECYLWNEEELAKIRASDNTGSKAKTTRSTTPATSSLKDNAGGTPTTTTTAKLPIHSTRTAAAAAAGTTTITTAPSTIEMLMQEVQSLKADVSQLSSAFEGYKRAHSVSCCDELNQLKSELRQLRSDFDAYRLAHPEPPVQWPSTAAPVTAPVTTASTSAPVVSTTKTVLVAVHKELSDKQRRQKNVIVYGLKPAADVSDTDLFLNICTDHLNVKPVVIRDKSVRLGRPQPGRVQPLRVVLESDTAAAEIIRHSRRLRDCADCQGIYINPDLTPSESQAAFENRQRRRARAASASQQMQQTAQLSPSAASFVPRQQDT